MTRIEECGQVIATNFNELGLSVEFAKGYESPLGDTLFFNLTYISQFNKNYLKSLIEKIAVYHHLDMELVDTKEAHFGVFVKSLNNKVSLSQLLCDNNDIVIGLDNRGQPVKLDFEKIPHLLIAGTTGSGKSVLIHNLICNLIVWYGRHKTKIPQFVIIDPKGNELDRYKNVSNTTFIDNTRGAIAVLNYCCEEMDRRYRENDMSKNDLYIIIDELADLMLTSKFECEESIVRLAQKGRACGIHLIVATQRPTIDVCSGLIKANMPYRIALKTASVRDSIVILDHKGAEALKGNGDCIVKLGLDERHTQVAYPESELIAKVVEVNNAKRG